MLRLVLLQPLLPLRKRKEENFQSAVLVDDASPLAYCCCCSHCCCYGEGKKKNFSKCCFGRPRAAHRLYRLCCCCCGHGKKKNYFPKRCFGRRTVSCNSKLRMYYVPYNSVTLSTSSVSVDVEPFSNVCNKRCLSLIKIYTLSTCLADKTNQPVKEAESQ